MPYFQDYELVSILFLTTNTFEIKASIVCISDSKVLFIIESHWA